MMRKFFMLASVLFTLLGCNKEPEDAVISKLAGVRGYKNWYIGNFRCGVFVPPLYDPHKKYPLIVILHGHSDTTSWNYRWYNEPFVTDDPCIVLSPKCPVSEEEGWGSSWNPNVSPMMQKAFEMLDLAKKAFNLDTTRFYIHGTSMGAIGTYGVLQKNPGLFTAAYLECGAGNSDIAPLLLNTPLWVFHGSNDYVVYPTYDRAMYQEVTNRGGKLFRYTEYNGVGHNVWDYTRNEKTLPYWLLAQKKGVVRGIPDSTFSFSLELTGEKKIKLNWQAPADFNKDGNQVWYYKIYRNGELLKEAEDLEFVDSTASVNNLMAYQVSVVNFFFKESARSKARFITIDKE